MILEVIDDEEEQLLSLSLAIVSDSGRDSRKRKRNIRSRINVDNISYDDDDGQGCSSNRTERKIFRLLRVREQMLKLDQHKKNIINKKVISSSTANNDGRNNNGVHLIHLLLLTATAINENDTVSALENLNELYEGVSLNGDSVQRVVAYFADGLAAKILTRKSPFFDVIMKEPTVGQEFLAFIHLYRVSPYYQFAHFTANQAIIEAFEKEDILHHQYRDQKNLNRALHVIDFDISYGFQWPSLIQSLSEKATGGSSNQRPISLRITGFGRNQEELQETENRLVSFAKGFRNLVFDFQGLLRGHNSCNIINKLRSDRNETVAVNLVFHLNTLSNNSEVSGTLNWVHSINPSIVILVEQEGSRATPRTFLSRFMESLHYFAAMFDSLEDCLPLDSAERLSIEKNLLGNDIKTMLNYDFDHHDHCDHHDYDHDHYRCPKYERLETWKARMTSHGFGGVRISSKSVIQAKLLLKMRTNYCAPLQFDGDSCNGGGFRVFERDEGRAISLGWQNRYLLTASVWQCL